MRHCDSNVARWLARALTVAVLILGTVAGASAQVVISQVYGAGGNSGAVLRNDYVELFNRGAAPASLAGMSIQYASATGTGNFSQITLLSGSLNPGQYYLVQMSGGANGAPIPTPDATGTASMAAGAGKVVLVNSTSALACNGSSTPCSASQLALIVDLVGYGTTANFFEGAGGTPTISTTTAAFRASAGCTDTNNNAADFTAAAPAPRNSASALGPCGGVIAPAITVNPTSGLVTTEPGGTASFTVVLATQPTGDVTIGLTSSDLTEGTVSPSGLTFTTGNWNVSQSVVITGVDDPDADGNIAYSIITAAALSSDTNYNGIDPADVAVTNTNDDVAITLISAVQGSGATSPLANQLVTVTGIVTGRKSNGFFVQSRLVDEDGNPATSEGIFVFTNSTPSASAAVGNLVQVAATVLEYVPSAGGYAMTELSGSPTVLVLSTGMALPAPVTLTSAEFLTVGGLEKYEAMRVVVPQLNVVAPTDGNVIEASATSTSNGVFFGVLPQFQRPFREPGIDIFAPISLAWPATVPRFDSNPERLRIDDGLGSGTIDVATGAVLTNVVGILENGYTNYTLLLDPSNTPGVSGGQAIVGVPSPRAGDVTVGSLNFERFFDDVADGNGGPTLTTTAVNNRLNKASLTIREVLKTPDILAVVEMENLSILGRLANKVNADAVVAGAPNPGYQAFLVEGNDSGGIDVGFLTKANVSVNSVVQVGKNAIFALDGSLLNDRPPLQLSATVTPAVGAQLSLTVIVNHLRSLIGVDDLTAATGDRVRAKRAAQAEFLASHVQSLQSANPSERIVLVGDFNAFEVSDGYVDVMGTLTGTPAPASQVVVASPDLVNPDLVNLTTAVPPATRYSYSFDGNAQVLDHVLVTQNLMNLVSRVSFSRSNADQPETLRNNANSPARLSDHDGVVVAFAMGAPRLVGQVVAKTAGAATIDVRFTNSGTGNVIDGRVAGITFRTMAGIGTVTLAGPALPIALGVIAPGQSVVRTLALNVPAGVTRFTVTETGSFTSAAGDALRFSSTQTVIK